jgi:hypothetical protein
VIVEVELTTLRTINGSTAVGYLCAKKLSCAIFIMLNGAPGHLLSILKKEIKDKITMERKPFILSKN